MKITVYGYRPEKESFQYMEDLFGVELILTEEMPSLNNVELARGSQAISIVTEPFTEPLLEAFYKLGIRYVSTRTIGYEHIDTEAAKRIGMRFGNVSYSPYSVAEFSVMLMLMALRKVKTILENFSVQDFSIDGLKGSELHGKTIGVIGTGNIGKTVISILKGFQCKIIAYDYYPSQELKDYYVSYDELLNKSDIITLHIPLQKGGSYLINAEEFQKMKDGVVLINTARGKLIDTRALIQSIESGKIGAAALDVLENEKSYFANRKNEILADRELAILRAFPNVILTPHFAFYTEQAVKEMAENSIKSCIMEIKGDENPWRK